jgi:hypothetical protein
MKYLKSLFCKIVDHKASVEKEFSDYERKVTCLRCRKSWAMHDKYKFLMEWDEYFEEIYSEEANKKREYYDMLAGRWRNNNEVQNTNSDTEH